MNTKITKKGNNKYLVFDILEGYKNLIHGFTTKNAFNVEYDDICDDLNLNKEKKCIIKSQAHSKFVKIINDNEEITDVDGLITNKPNIPLFIRTADCNSIILYDPKKKVIANIHSGWKGTVQRIIEEALNTMIREFGTNPHDIIACLFPSIRYCHFEVDEDVYDLYKEEFQDIQIEYSKIGKKIKGKQKYYIDLTIINKMMLINKNVKSENIYISDYCTICNNDLFSSHRMKDEGRNITVIELKE